MKTCYETCIPKKFLMDDKQLSHVLKFLPPPKDVCLPGRPPIKQKSVIQAIFYLLKTGCQWNALPRCFGPSSTIHENFQKLIQNNVFLDAWHHALEKYDRFVGLALREQSLDCAHTKAPLGGEQTGISPVDRRKIGTKRSMLTDKNGIPLVITVSAGNTHDSKLCISTIDACMYKRKPAFKMIELDAAFDAQSIKESLRARKYDYRISENKRRKEVVTHQKHRFRWAVERTHSWINRFRRLLIRWDKKVNNFLGMLQFSCQIIVLAKI